MQEEISIKSKERKQKFGEVFTPHKVVCDMIDLVDHELGDDDYGFKTWFDPAVGTGNFPAEILKRKLEWCDKNGLGEIAKLRALASIYAVDIQQDNVEETRARLLSIFFASCYCDLFYTATAKAIVDANIVLGDTINHPEDIVFLKYEEEGFPLKVTEHRLSDMLGEDFMKDLEKRRKAEAKRNQAKASKAA